jgi:hypothetical protein
MANTTLASAMEAGLTSVDLFLITFSACLLFLCLAILHLLTCFGRCWTAVLTFSFVLPLVNR